MRSNRLSLPVLIVLVASAIASAQAPAPLPFVSPIFGDNMVLQRGKPNTIWGWSKPGDTVRVEIADRSASAVAGPDGRWQLKILPPAPGGPYLIRIQGPQQTLELHEVLVGDVWLAGGQSNMLFGLKGARNAEEEIKTADHPEIRFFIVKERSSYSHADVPKGSGWKIASPATVGEGPEGGMSAAGYYFARKLQDALHVPIGIVEDCLGGTPAESWMSVATLRQLKDFDAPLDEIERLRAKRGPEYGNYIMGWYDEYDIGQAGKTWADPELDDAAWTPVQIPGNVNELGAGMVPSVSWLRREITLPDPLPAGQAKVILGTVDKMDTTYINGRWVGASSWVESPRVYHVPDGVLKPGANLFAFRFLKLKPEGGFLAKAADLRLVLGDGTVVPLAGTWRGKISVDARPPHPMPLGYENYPTMPAVLYQGMLQPMAPLAITGALWYQGEANSERAFQYRTLLPAMISDWRKLFAQGDFPFYIVSLPAFMQRKDVPGDDSWAETREAQAMTARVVPHSCLAVTIDTGDADNIHPKDKKEVGDRLALCALAEHYGQKVVYQGPTLKSVERLPGLLKLHFDHIEGGLIAKDGKPAEFSIAGADRKWYWADARIEGDAVVVSSASVPDPKEARYAWQSNPAATLFNGAGLPAVPFRTDDWPGMTQGHKPY